MKRDYLPLKSLPAWAKFNGIALHGAAFQSQGSTEPSAADKGNAIVATVDKDNNAPTSDSHVLLHVPSDLVLSLDAVYDHSKSDPDLRVVLDAMEDFGKTMRGAIMIFLLVQITHRSKESMRSVGLSNPWTEYIQYLPPSFPLPTLYSEAERGLLRGTSLADAVEAKIGSLEKEFDLLRNSTENIPWCQQCWWDDESDGLTLDDWKYVDAAYRSRMLEIPNAGHAMVPCIDMANHAADSVVNALYDADAEGNVVLKLRPGKNPAAGEEITISYGNEKPASEMIFSYGFLDDSTRDARQIMLGINFNEDDPLGMAKKMLCKDTPGLKISAQTESSSRKTGSPSTPNGTTCDSPLIWWSSVNEEDGLNIGVVQTVDGQRELEATWQGEKIQSSTHLQELVAEDVRADIFQLRALVLTIQRLEEQLAVLLETDQILSSMQDDKSLLESMFSSETLQLTARLRSLEAKLLQSAIEDLIQQRDEALKSDVVMRYLAEQNPESEDFS